MRLSELQTKPAELSDLRHVITHRGKDAKKYKSGVGAMEDTFYVAVDALRNYGFKPIGTGAKGTVFQKPGYPYVLKLFGDDNAYLAWLDFCRKHQGNPYVPKVKGKPIHIKDGFYGIRLEQLSKGKNRWGIAAALTTLVQHYTSLFVRNLTLPVGTDLSYIKEFFPNYSTDQNLKELIQGVHELKQRGIELDIHDDNVMFRGKQIVLIDALKDR